jgi:hypothetical protein
MAVLFQSVLSRDSSSTSMGATDAPILENRIDDTGLVIRWFFVGLVPGLKRVCSRAAHEMCTIPPVVA